MLISAERKRSSLSGENIAAVAAQQANSGALPSSEITTTLLNTTVDGSTGSLPQYVTIDTTSKI